MPRGSRPGKRLAATAKIDPTPLWAATKWDRPDVVDFLLAHGADPNIADNEGKTPLQVADTSTRDLLLRYGAKK
jgi:ankyrin repeat protein